MGDRTGCGLTELAILEALSAATGGRPRAHVVCTKAVAAIEERIGLGPRYGYEVLLDLARPWIVPVPTVSVVATRVTGTFQRPPGRSTPNAAHHTRARSCSMPRPAGWPQSR